MNLQQEVLNIKNVSFNYATQQVIKNIDFSAKIKETILLTGHSGSGKTTLLHIIGKILKPNTGSVDVNGKIGFVFQLPNLISTLSCQENIALNAAINDKQSWHNALIIAQEILVQAQLQSHALHLPHELSGGQAQRIAILRALAGHPNLLLCDEPTGNLDHESAQIILNMLFKYTKKNNATLLVISHNLELIPLFNRHLHLNEGVLIEKYT